MKIGGVGRIAGVALVAWMAAPGQVLLSPDQVDQARKAFAGAAVAARLRCEISPVQPALNYSLRLQTGYVLDVPLAQLRGSGHGLRVLVRVTPEGGKAVYLGSDEGLPEIPEATGDGEFTGTFWVGEGTYGVEALVEDEANRACSSKWRIQAKLTGRERELRAAMQPGEVAEAVPARPRAAEEPASASRIERLTILLNAAPLNPRAAKLEAETAAMLRDSIGSLLEQLPAKRVRLVAFNADQQVVLLDKNGFGPDDLNQLTAAFDQLQVAAVDYRKLQSGRKTDVVSDLVLKELRDPQPASAAILLGPRTAWTADGMADASLDGALSGTGGPRWFYLEYQQPTQRPLLNPQRGRQARMNGGGVGMGRRFPSPDSRPDDRSPLAAAPDGMEQLLRRLKGETIAIQNPHDLAGAIRRMAGEIPKAGAVGAPADGTVPRFDDPPSQRPFLLGSSDPDLADDVPALPGAEADEQVDPVQVLTQLRDQVLANGQKIPNHTCVETIERNVYVPVVKGAGASCDTLLARRKQGDVPLRLDTTDWLRLDVGLAANQEIYSWVGARKFEEGEVDELVPEGAMGTGPFGTMLLSVFEKRDPGFRFEGATMMNGRRLLAYSFDVPQDESHYQVKAHNDWIVTGYTGRVLVDPETADLVRFSVRTEELPPATSSCEVDTTQEYGLVPLGNFEYLLPKFTRQRFIARDGTEAENRLTFASCREFRGQSTLTFGEEPPPAGTAAPANAVHPMALPAGLPLTVDLAEPVPFEHAAAGDRIVGRLAKPVLDEQGKTLAPEGAKVEGRLMRVEVRHSSADERTIVLRWETMELGGFKVPLELNPSRRKAELQPVPRGTLRMRVYLPRPNEERYGVYRFPGQMTELEGGFRTEWVTVAH